MNARVFAHPEMRSADVAADLAAAGFALGPPSSMARTVLDTFDGRLHAAGLRLELRDGRELILSEGRAAPAHVAVSAVPSFGADLPAGPFRHRLSPILGVRALLPLMTVTVQRSVALRRGAAGKIHVAVAVQDRIAVDGAPVRPGVAVEIEAMEGYAKAAAQTQKLLVSIGMAPRPGGLFDLVSGDAGVDLCGYQGSPSVPLDRREPAEDGFRRVLVQLADVIDANLDGTVRAVDPEFLHDLRVAVRRTRSVLAQARDVVPGPGRARFRGELAWLGGETGPARDLDVYVVEWDRYVAPLGAGTAALLEPVFTHLSELRRAHHAALAETMWSDRCRDLLAAWRSWLQAGDHGDPTRGRPPEAGRALGTVVVDRIQHAHAHLVERGRRIGPEAPATDLHELRKDAKKLRYLIECFGGLLSNGPRRSFVQHLKALQENLGEHQDTEVQALELRVMAQDLHRNQTTTADTLLAMGQLAEHFEQRRRAARDEFAVRFAAYDAKRTRRALRDLLAPVGGM